MASALTALGFNPRVFLLNVIAFLILFAVLRRYLFGPLAHVMKRRAEEIAEGLEASRRNREALAEADQRREQILAAAREEGREQVRRSVQEGEAERERILAEARVEVQGLRERGREAVARERERALLELRQRVVDLALLAAGRAVAQRLDERVHRQVIDDFITDLESREGAGAGPPSFPGSRGGER